MALYHGHDRAKLLADAIAKRQDHVPLSYPSGKGHVLLPSGQQINPAKDHRTKKQRVRERRHRREHPVVPVNFPLIEQPAVLNTEPAEGGEKTNP